MRTSPRRGARTPIAILAAVALAAGALVHALPFAVWASTHGIAFGLYACDKVAAERGRWRTSERTLHLVAFFGGWPGALLAQDLVRHKSRRPSFQAMSWCTAVANGAAVAWWLHARGNTLSCSPASASTPCPRRPP